MDMNFKVKPTKGKIKASYKTLYISDDLIDHVMEIANKNNTSFNNVIISMIEKVLLEKGFK